MPNVNFDIMSRGKTIFILMTAIMFSSCVNHEKNRRNNQISANDSSIINISLDTIKSVPPPGVKYCVDYKEANSWDSVAEKYDYDFLAYSHKNQKYLEGKKRLTDQQTKLILFGGRETVDITNIWSDLDVSTENLDEYLQTNEFYVTDTIASNALWACLVIEKIEANGSQVFLVTIDRNQKLMSKARIAFYFRSGTYTANDGSRPPWFAMKTACIYDNLIIMTDDNQGGEKRYSIGEKGFIVEVKGRN